MKEVIHPDWERIKKIIDTYGNKNGFNKGVFLSKFIEEVESEIKYLDRFYGSWCLYYEKLIKVILKSYPEIPIKKLLNKDGTYSLIENEMSYHESLEIDLLEEWKNTDK